MIPKNKRGCEVRLRDIDHKPQDIEANESEAWVQEMLARSAPEAAVCGLEATAWAKASRFTSQVHLEKLTSEYEVRGHFSARVPMLCAHCADAFTAERGGDFRIFAHILDKKDRLVDDNGDPDFIFLRGDVIDISEILAEQLITQESIAEHCAKCEKQLEQDEQSAGQADEFHANSPFSQLKDLLKKRD